MNSNALNLPPIRLPEAEIFGPYSPWPRRKRKLATVRQLTAGGTVAAAAVFAHCVLPLL
jgi:hypothetical protein